MPITPPGMIGALTAGLAATANTGISVPQLAAGITAGIMTWLPTIQVNTVDVGLSGVGGSVFPLTLSPPALIAAMLSSVAALGLVGTMSAPFATGLALGLVTGFGQSSVITSNPSVGLGTGFATFAFQPPMPFLLASVAAVGVTGVSAPQVATAVGLALTEVFATSFPTVSIVGLPSITPGFGKGTGKLV